MSCLSRVNLTATLRRWNGVGHLKNRVVKSQANIVWLGDGSNEARSGITYRHVQDKRIQIHRDANIIQHHHADV
jgi:hypothetical protein